MHALDKFFEPRSLAVLGASADPAKLGNQTMSTLVTGGFKGKIYPVNPKGGEVCGLKAYTTIAEIPETPELTIVVVPAAAVYRAIEECAACGIKNVIVISAGFAELGEKGSMMQREFAELAKRSGITMLGPNCYGVLSPSSKLYATFVPHYPPHGDIGIISQSGNLAMWIAASAEEHGIGTSRLVGIGNEADLHSEDFLDYMASDDKTKVILSYIEGIRSGRKFFDIAGRATRKKPFVMIKGGASPDGARAAGSHTASLANSDIVVDAMCRQAGIIRAENLSEMVNIGLGFLSNPLPKGRRVGMVTGAGGLGVLATDACSKRGLKVVKLSEAVLKELDALMPPWWSRSNPVDIAMGGYLPAQIKVLEILARSDELDCMMVLTGIGGDGESAVKDNIRDCLAIKEIAEKYQKPIYMVFELLFQPEYQAKFRQESGKNNIATYTRPDEAVMVLSAMAQYYEYLQSPV